MKEVKPSKEKDKRPPYGTKAFDEWVKERAERRAREIFSTPPAPDFDDGGVHLGGPKTMEMTDAEAFPDDLDEYMPEEKKLRLVKDDKAEK